MIEVEHITPRELEAWRLIANGHTRESIGHQMGISTRTADCHLLNLTRKLGLLDCGGLPFPFDTIMD